MGRSPTSNLKWQKSLECWRRHQESGGEWRCESTQARQLGVGGCLKFRYTWRRKIRTEQDSWSLTNRVKCKNRNCRSRFKCPEHFSYHGQLPLSIRKPKQYLLFEAQLKRHLLPWFQIKGLLPRTGKMGQITRSIASFTWNFPVDDRCEYLRHRRSTN